MPKQRFRFRSSIYGQVVYTITLLSFILFLSFGVIFRSVNEGYLRRVIRQNGNNIGSIVEGALYHSMLTNDRSALQNTLDVINTLPGIEDVNMYDNQDNLVYSPFSTGGIQHDNPNCKDCHANIGTMFPAKEKSFKIVNLDSKCEMSQKDYPYRLLLIRSPILNEASCYTSACHAHSESEEVLGSFVIRIPLEDLDSSVKKSTKDFFILAALTTLLLVTFLRFFTRRNIKRPLNEIIKASENVTRGDKSTRLDIKNMHLKDMIMVSSAFNEMLDNLQSATEELQNWSQQLEYKVQKKSEEISEMQNELIHVERIASLGKLSSSVAHEINNPLSGVLTYTKLVNKQLRGVKMDEKEKAPMLKYLKVIEEETKRCGDIVKSLLDFSRKDPLDFKIYHLHNVVREANALLEHQLKMSNISFETDFSAKSDLIECSENQIKQACIAILLNASEAVIENGEIIVKTTNPDNENIKLEIKDNGIGIAPEDIAHVFEPFYSAKEKVSGIGLGLAIVHGIVQSHKGKVEVISELGRGTTISITLPLVKS
ncbi:MAG: HAMP domain-containing sensor histidine kinase [Bacteroidia bacterium]|nr:MAG: HAMP domain-containing sensor histidine kinase [Bacteroidia bacterium]